MATLAHKVQNALDEARILVLGAQVLLGFELRSVFETRFPALPASAQHLKLAALLLQVTALALLVAPAMFHRLVEQGEDTRGVQRVVTRFMVPVLFCIALAMTFDVWVAAGQVLGFRAGLAVGAAVGLIGVTCFYGLEAVSPHRAGAPRGGDMEKEEKTPIENKIRHVLTETRVVLPGAQALMGFQFATMLTEPFAQLPRSSQLIHLVSLGLVALVIILLLTPAAYHRLVERGEETDRFHRFASRMLVAAAVPLALGIAADVFVVARKVLGATGPAVGLAVGTLMLCYGLWFGLALALRRSEQDRERPRADRPARA